MKTVYLTILILLVLATTKSSKIHLNEKFVHQKAPNQTPLQNVT